MSAKIGMKDKIRQLGDRINELGQEKGPGEPVGVRDNGGQMFYNFLGIVANCLFWVVAVFGAWILFVKGFYPFMEWLNMYSGAQNQDSLSNKVYLFGSWIMFGGFAIGISLITFGQIILLGRGLRNYSKRWFNQVLNLGLAYLPKRVFNIWRWHWKKIVAQGGPDALGVLQAMPAKARAQLSKTEIKELLLSKDRGVREEAIKIFGQYYTSRASQESQ